MELLPSSLAFIITTITTTAWIVVITKRIIVDLQSLDWIIITTTIA
jgi:hypothetical protein